MKACRLVFDMALDGPAGGLLVPDLLKPGVVPDESPRVGTWMYATEFLPEKVFLRFIARQYDSIDQQAGRCFRNQIVWRKGDADVALEAHYSPAGETLPYVLIRSAKPKESVPETVAVTIQALFDEIYKEERLGHVQSELIEFGKPSRRRAHGPYVFRCEMMDGRPKYTIVFSGIDLGSTWKSLVGLGHLQRLIRQPGIKIHVDDFFRAERGDAASDYRYRQEEDDDGSASEGAPRPSTRHPTKKASSPSRFAKYSTPELKKSLKGAERELARARDSEAKRTCEQQIELLNDEIDRRKSSLKKAMNSVQSELKKAVGELKARMKEKEIPQEHWGHFDHCTSSAGHEFHFSYEKPKAIAWDTSNIDD
jgi:hypothetical protein